METVVNQQKAKTVTLDDRAQAKVVQFVIDIDKKGRDERKVYEDGEQGWKECEKAYHCRPFTPLPIEQQWQSNHVIPWAYDAVESWYAYLHGTLIPSNDKIFTIEGRTEEDKKGAETMEKYMEYRFEKNKFPEQIGKALKQLAIKNHTCVKTYWRDDRRISYEWKDEPIIETRMDATTGQPIEIPVGYKKVRVPIENKVYSNVWFDVIDINDVSFYPITGAFDEVNFVHSKSMFLEDLEAQVESGTAPYFNIEKVREENSKKDDNPEPTDTETGASATQGLVIKEAWISRIKIGDKVYKNYVATIVNDKTLVRFQPNPNDYGKKPFTWICLNPDGNKLYGYGLLSKGVPLLKGASFIFNQRLNEIKLKLHGSYKYYDDGVFNPYNVISQPGALIPVSDAVSAAGNLVPLNPNLQHIQLAYTEVAEIKAEFEEVTVPAVVKGQIEEHDTTATEINNVQSNSSGKMNVQAYHINENLLKPLLEWDYLLTYQRMQFDDDIKLEIARLTVPATKQANTDVNGAPIAPMALLKSPQELIAELPQFIPYPDIDINMVGYQNVIKKQQQGQAMAVIIPQLAQSPAAPFLKWYEIAEQAFNTAELDPSRYLMTPDEMAQQQQQGVDPMAQAQMQLEQMKLQIQMMSEENKARNDEMANSLKALEIELKYRLEDAKLNQEREQAETDLMMQDRQMQQQQYNEDANRQHQKETNQENLKAKASESKSKSD